MADTSKAPERILAWGDGHELYWRPAEELPADKHDSEYVRADLYDAAQAEVARLTAALAEAGELEAAIRDEIKAPKDWPTIYAVKAVHRALAEAETRGAERMREAAAVACGDGPTLRLIAQSIRALSLPPRERDGQEGE